MNLYLASLRQRGVPVLLGALGICCSSICAAASPPPNVILILADDLGYGDLGCYGHPQYEGGIRVPGIIRWPGKVPVGKIDEDSVVAGVDWLPSVCKIAGVAVPADHKLDGEDVSDVFLGHVRARATPLMWEWRFRIFGEPFHQSPMLAIRDGDWKLLLNPDRSRVELYEIKKDRTQLNNVAEHYPDVVAKLSEKVLAWPKELPPGPMDPGAGRMSYPWPGREKSNPPTAAGKKRGKSE